MSRSATNMLAAAASVLLTLSCLGPLFLPHGGWIGPAVAAVLLAAVCGAFGRALPLSGLSGTILVLAGGIGLVTAVGAPHLSYLGFVPNGKSLSLLRTEISSGFSDIRTYSPPVPASPGLILIVTASVFAVAVAVDLFAVGAQRPVLAGIPLLALVAVPAAFRPHGLGVIHLLLAFVGWLLLVAVDSRDRLIRWGRPLGRRSSVNVPLLLGGAAGRVAGVGVIAAFVLPALLPDLHGGIIHPPSRCCAGGSATVVPPLVTIDNQLHEHGTAQLLSVTTTSPQYLRFTALDTFDGNSFSLVKSDAAPGKVDGRLSSGTPGITDEIPQTPVQATIHVLPTLAERYLPLPYSPVDVAISGTWQLSPSLRTIFSTTETTAGKTFSVDSLVPVPTREQLQALPAGYDAAATPKATADALAIDLAVPASVPSVVFTEEAKVVEGRKTAFDRLAALERWFTTPADGGFTYTLTPSPALPSGSAGITAFLKYRMGFCEQFATVFTLMARHLGLPARVAVGFTPGEPDPTSPGTFDVSTGDAHAWPEVWFSGVGWVRFEPTPRQSLASFTPSYLATVTPPAQTKPVAVPSAAPTAAPIKKPDADALKPKPVVVATSSGSGASTANILTVLVVAMIILLMLSPGLGRLLVRRGRVHAARVGAAPGADPAETAAGSHALWSELMDTVRDVGVLLPASETPRATGRRLAGLLVPAHPEERQSGGAFASRGAARRRAAAGGAGSGGVDVIEVDSQAETVESGSGRDTRSRSTPGADDQRQLLAALGRVVGAEEQARYGRPGGSWGSRGSGSRDTGSDDVRLISGALISSAPGGVRLRALFLPRSVLGRARARAARGSGRVGRLAAAAGAPARVLGRLIRRG